MTRTAAVTGATGFIGGHLVPALLDRGWAVRACGRRPRPEGLPAGVEYRRVDLADGEGVRPLVKGADVVFHLAGASSSLSSQDEMQRINVGGTENLAAAAHDAGVGRFVHVSSTSVYGEEEALPQPVPEDVRPKPSRGYGKAKWGAEQAVGRFADKGLPAVVIRPVTVFGPGNFKLLGSAVLDAAIERFAGLSELAVHREQVEQRLVHIDDMVAACMHLARSEAAVGRAFNVTLPYYPSSHEVAGILADELGLRLELADDADCGLPHDQRADLRERMLAHGMRDDILLTEERLRFLRKANRNNRLSVDALTGTGFEFAETDLPAAIGRTVAWYRENRWIL